MKPDRQEELQESLDFLRGRFEELNRDIKLPHSLDAEVLRARLEEIEEVPEERSGKVIRWRAIASVAACFVVVLGAVWFLNSGAAKSADLLDGPALAEAETAEMPETAADMAAAPADAPAEAAMPMLASAASGGAEAAYYAADYTEVRDTIYRLAGDRMLKGSFSGDLYLADGAAPEAGAVEDAAPAADAGGMIRSAPAAFSGTNVQEAGVDEADIVKTDGKYLYSYVYQNTTSQSPAIFIADAQEMTLTATIEVDPAIDEFYLDGDRLVTVGYSADELPAPKQTVVEATDDSLVDRSAASGDAASWNGGSWDGGVEMTVYDISDPAEPQEVRTFRQDGNYVSSRLMDGTLYLVSRKYVYADLTDKRTPLSDIVPVCFESGAAEPRLLPADKIAIAPDCSSADYAVVSAVNVRTGKSDTRAVLGGGDGVYMSTDNLYVYYDSWRGSVSDSESYRRTGIVKFSAGGKLDLMGTAWIDGYVDGQFAFSEFDGNLRVAATAEYPVKGVSNNLYVLDSGMRQIGRLEGLAPGERIYSVRYLGEMAYVVTFRETDPLFAIDLSNPRAPKVLGQLKIPGFSEYLHPLDDGLLLGIGQSVDERGTANGVKLSMFDVSDPLNPKELYVYNFGGEGVWAEALSNHKAVLFDEERSLFGFAVDTGFGRIVSRYYVFSYGKDADGFTLKAKISHDDFGPNAFSGVNRGLYIGNTLYTFSPDWIVSYDLDSFTRKEILRLK